MSTINQNWEVAGECLPKEDCISFNDKQFPNRQKDQDGKIIPLSRRTVDGRLTDAQIYDTCCGESGSFKCKPSKITIIETYLTVYNSVLSDPLRELIPNVDYCPDEDDEDSLCPPKSERSGNLELVIVANKQLAAFDKKPEKPGYRKVPRVGCGGKDITPEKPNQYAPALLPGDSRTDEKSVPGFPIIIPITYTVAGIPVIKSIRPEKGENKDFFINGCPIGPKRINFTRLVTQKTCNGPLGGVNLCAAIGMPIEAGSAVCYRNNIEDLCNLEQCMQFEGNLGQDVENDSGDKGFKIDVQAFIRKKDRDSGWDCVGYKDSPYVVISRYTGTTILNEGTENQKEIDADFIRIDISIGNSCEETGKVPPINRLRKRSLYRRQDMSCENRNSGCTQILVWDNKDTPPITPAGYELVNTYTCEDADSSFNSKSQINIDKNKIAAECAGDTDINGYCCVTNTVTGQKTIETTTFNSCCQSDNIPGLSASWLGTTNDLTEAAAIATCDPCVACCVGSDNNNALCVYTFQDKVSGKWTYAKEIVTGDTADIRSAACDAFTSSGVGNKIFVDKIAQEAEVSIQDKDQVGYEVRVQNITDLRKFKLTVKPPYKNNFGEIVTWDKYLDGLRNTLLTQKSQAIIDIKPLGLDAHILFSSINGTLETVKEIKTDDQTDFTCNILCPSTTTSKGYQSGSDKCEALNGVVVLTQNANNADQFFAQDPCSTLSINCNDLPEPPENKPNPSDNPELPQPLPKEETPDEPKTPPNSPDPKKPPDKQPRRCVDVTFTYDGNTHNVAISFPLNIQDELFGEQLNLTFNNNDELLAYIQNEINNVRAIPDKILALMGINKADTNDGVLTEGASWTNGSEYDCGDTPAPDAPPLTPDPEGPVDEEDPPTPTECACLSINNRPTIKVNLPITFREDGVDYNLDSPQKLNEYLNSYILGDGKINNTFIAATVQIALGIDSPNDAALRFTHRMIPCDCDKAVPDNPNAPDPKKDKPSSPPKRNPQQPPENIECNNKKAELKKNKEYLSRLEESLTKQKNVIAENLDELDKLITRWNSDCGNDWFPSFKCDNLAKKICELWDGTGSIPTAGTKSPNNFPSKIAGKNIKPGKTAVYNKEQLAKTTQLIAQTKTEIQTLETFLAENC